VPCRASGTVRDIDDTPIAGARLEIWEADEDGLYDSQYPDGRMQARGWLSAGEQGE